MGIKALVRRAGNRAADTITKLSVLSPEQLHQLQERRDAYLLEKPEMTGEAAEELTRRMLAAGSIEIYNEYLLHLKDFYVPVKEDAEYETSFHPGYNIRYFNITKWVSDKKENSLEKLINVYAVLSNEDCNIALVFHRLMSGTKVYLAVTNTQNAEDNVDVENYRKRLEEAIRGNFPGTEWESKGGKGVLPCMKDRTSFSVAIASNIPGENSEKFVSQTIEKLLDGIIPDTREKEYILVLLATPINDMEDRKLHLADLYTGLAPYAGWQTNFTYTQADSTTSMATFGVNAGVSAGVQSGRNSSVSNTSGTTETEGETTTDSTGKTTTDSSGTSETQGSGSSVTDSTGTTATDTTGSASSTGTSKTTSSGSSHTKGSSSTEGSFTSNSATGGVNAGVRIGSEEAGVSIGGSVSTSHGTGTSSSTGTSVSDTISSGVSEGVSETISESTSRSIAESAGRAVAKTTEQAVSRHVEKAVSDTIGRAVSNSLSRAVSKSTTAAAGIYKGINMGGNFGANFARSSNVSATIGKNEGIQQTFTNFSIKHTLEILEMQMKRLEQSTALGMWDFSAYVMSEDQNVANNVAHSYLALTQGEESYLSQTAVNLWRGDMGEGSDDAREICAYLRELRHPVFGLNPGLALADSDFSAYPPVVSATTSLSGKELAYSLNFPQRSLAGFPVLECAEFGRNVVTYHQAVGAEEFDLGQIFHMNHEETGCVRLQKNSLAAHTFITGSTGSGKSNTVYQLLKEASFHDVKFMVIEPSKGEYKDIFGMFPDVSVYGTNPYRSPLLRLNPFRFPEGVHLFEHLERLVEIFNACWPMYAAMPAVLKRAVEKSYADCGWDLLRSRNRYREPIYPDFRDIARNVREIIDTSEYDAENKGAYKGSLLTRLNSLTTGLSSMIFASDEIAPETLFGENTIIDLSRVGSSETKALIMGMLILKLQEFRMSESRQANAGLQHLTVLEEAHTILRRTSAEQFFDSANLMGKSVEMIASSIAEMRTYGEGFIIVDQAPGLLDLAAIRNTNTKIIMRLPDQEDRELVGYAANLNEDQITELAKLPCGVAAVYQNEWIQPVLCKMDRFEDAAEPYTFEPDETVFEKNQGSGIEEKLLQCLMNKELFREGHHEELWKLKDAVIRSDMESSVKADLMEYLYSDPEKGLVALRHLLYDLLSAENAIRASEHHVDIHEWVEATVKQFQPSVENYSKKQIDLTVMLILQEKMARDSSYKPLLTRFLECYKQGEGVF